MKVHVPPVVLHSFTYATDCSAILKTASCPSMDAA